MSREQDRFDKRLEETAQELDQAAQETLDDESVQQALDNPAHDESW